MYAAPTYENLSFAIALCRTVCIIDVSPEIDIVYLAKCVYGILVRRRSS